MKKILILIPALALTLWSGCGEKAEEHSGHHHHHEAPHGGTVVALEADDAGATLRVAVPDTLSRYLVEKGSVAIDGVSLTVARIEDAVFDVAPAITM